MPFLNFKFKIKKLKFAHGFTLVELLVVMAILGIMASLITYTMVGQQRKARDAQRKSDLKQVKNAMQSAKNDCKGSAYYPLQGSVNSQVRFSSLGTYLKDPDLKYMAVSVIDPKNSSPYIYSAAYGPSVASACPSLAGVPNGSLGTENYVLRSQLENANDPGLSQSFTQCTNPIAALSLSGGVNFEVVPSSGDGYYYVCNN